MIIVSQDKKAIVNYDKVQEIYISDKYISINFELNNNEVIGQYKTEARAKEVLQEIINKYRQWNKDANNAVTIIPKVYEMPKE